MVLSIGRGKRVAIAMRKDPLAKLRDGQSDNGDDDNDCHDWNHYGHYEGSALETRLT